MHKKKLCILFASIFIFTLFYVSDIPWKLRLRPINSSQPDLETYLKKAGTDCSDVVYEKYCVQSLQSEAQRHNASLGSVTLCTQGTVGFLHHVSVLCQRWGGPISVAVHSPPLDYPDARATVDALRHCDFCIRHWVSWHFFSERTTSNFIVGSGIPSFHTSQSPWDCEVVLRESGNSRRKSDGAYPINVGRNIARKKTKTPYIFSLDIELYPSSGVLPKFERMLRSSRNPTTGKPQVWILPVFEVYSNVSVPYTKFELKQMFYRKQAISFHKFRCNACHMIPNLTHWLNHDSQLKSEMDESLEEMRVLSTVQRSRKFKLHYWEPFFIGTNLEPEFDIRLSWEGKSNKMQMAYEMCLRNYSFHIVDNAFLVHAPGINIYNKKKERYREKYIHVNNRWISIIKIDLIKSYGNNTDC